MLVIKDQDGNVINIGPWQHDVRPVENPDRFELTKSEIKAMVERGQNPDYLYNEDGTVQELDYNPLPNGACEDGAEVIQREDGGLCAATDHARLRVYPSIAEQLDYIYHHGVDAWKSDMIKPVKDKYPKV